MSDLLVLATDLFFPDGISVCGNLDSFQFSLLDFNMKLCNSESRVAGLYETTKHKVLHLMFMAISPTYKNLTH